MDIFKDKKKFEETSKRYTERECEHKLNTVNNIYKRTGIDLYETFFFRPRSNDCPLPR